MHPPVPKAIALRTSEATYAGATEQMSSVRADLRALLRECPVADDVVLCASELAANAALHSRSCLPGGTFTVRTAIIKDAYVCIQVQDGGGHWTAVTGDQIGRHGLDIVRALASEWGIDGNLTTRTVWATFDWSITRCQRDHCQPDGCPP